jgi:uncharacterized protein YjbI with pentapeptide repeats
MKERVRFREITPEQLREVLNLHEKSVDSRGGEGACAWLWRVDLEGRNLEKANLRGANLQEANLRQADLRGARLQEASLWKVNLRQADLCDADLSGVTGLIEEQLGGANLSRCTLPKEFTFEGLKSVERLTRYARRLSVAALLGCLYTILTLGTTTDAQLLTDSSSSPLPLVGSRVPIVWFFRIAPLLLAGLYLYFQLVLQRLWDGLAKLPAFFPDGNRLDERVDPWLLSGLACQFVNRLKAHKPPFFAFQVLVTLILGWALVPFTLICICVRYMRTHDDPVMMLNLAVFSTVVCYGFFLFLSMRRTLAGKIRPSRTFIRSVAASCVWLTAGLIAFGSLSYLYYDLVHKELGIYSSRYPWLLTADLEEADVSTKPDNWTGKEEQIPFVKGADLRGSDLRYMRGEGAFLAKADLRDADLSQANLYFADLREARISPAKLRHATLAHADLTNATIVSADLTGANLVDADLTGAYLLCADLSVVAATYVTLASATITGADLSGADLTGADLRGAELTWTDLTDAVLWRADLADLRGWREIRSMTGALVWGVTSPPTGFMEWAVANGANSSSQPEERIGLPLSVKKMIYEWEHHRDRPIIIELVR